MKTGNRLILAIGAIAIGVFVLNVRLGQDGSETSISNEESRRDVSDSSAKESSNRIDAPSAIEISEAKAERNRLIAAFPDQYYDPDNEDPDYLKKVAYHHSIGAFLNSSRRQDHKYRRVMEVLLENGYGVEEWGAVVRSLVQINEPFWAKASLMREAGYAESEIEEELARPAEDLGSASWERARRVEGGRMGLSLSTGIFDSDIIDEFLALDMADIGVDETVVANTWTTILPGDKLYTDEDWIDGEFLKAQSRYGGEPRGNLAERIASMEEVATEPIYGEDGTVIGTRIRVRGPAYGRGGRDGSLPITPRGEF